MLFAVVRAAPAADTSTLTIVTDADSDSYYDPRAGTQTLPVLLILSCVGGVPHDIDSNMVIADSFGWMLVSCHGSRNHRSTAANEQDIMNTLTKLVRDYSVDEAHVYICGFSGMGA